MYTVLQMKAFFEKYPNAGAGASARSRALETISNNIKWLEKYSSTVETWIKNTSSEQM